MSSGVSEIGSQEHRERDGSRRGGAVTVTFGSLLARLRRAAGLTQMELALTAGVSTRHANFLERGRSRPSRAMVDRFCCALRVDARTRDRLLLAAGFAPESRADNARPAGPDLRESFAMALAQRIICDSVHETLQRLSDRSSAVREPLPDR